MAVEGVVREWWREQGWGVVDSPQTPGGCWVHFSAVDVDGYRELVPGQRVDLEVEAAEQDGYRYRATWARLRGADPLAPGPAAPRRLVTTLEVDRAGAGPDDPTLSISALHELELTDGRRVVLLDDRGWSADAWAAQSPESLAATARTVVGPDEPPAGRTREEEAALHWRHLAGLARARGVRVAPGELAALPHDVELGPGVRARLGR